MKTSNIVVINALSQLREYCDKQQKDLEELSEEITNIKKDRRLTAEERRDKNEYDGSAVAYFDVRKVIESKLIEVVAEE